VPARVAAQQAGNGRPRAEDLAGGAMTVAAVEGWARAHVRLC